LNNKIYAFGGFTYPDSGPPGWNAVNNAWEYDPATDEWKELAPMPTKRGAASAGVANGKIYVTGGANSLPGVNENGIHPARPHNVVATVEEYDPAANSWKTVRPLLLARNHHATVGVGDKIYVIGGRVGAAFISSASNNVDLVEMYDPATDLWTPRTRMPTARSAIGAGVYNNQILVAGGEGQDQRFLAAFKAVEAYDPVLNRWQVLPSMPHPRHGLAVGAVDNRLYTVSGDGQSAGNGIDHSAVAFNEILQVDLVLKWRAAQAPRIKTAIVGPRSPCEARISVSLTPENPREYAGEPAHSTQARLARPCRARHGLRRPAPTRTEGRADNFSLDINFVTAA